MQYRTIFGINKFLFQGAPGTGKTEAVKQLARILNREIYMVDFLALLIVSLDRRKKILLHYLKRLIILFILKRL